MASTQNLTKLPTIQYTGMDYVSVISQIQDIIENNKNWKSNWTQFYSSEAGTLLIQLMAWIADNLAVRQDLLYNENYLSTASSTSAINRLLKQINYLRDGTNGAKINLNVEINSAPTGQKIYLSNVRDDPNSLSFVKNSILKFKAPDINGKNINWEVLKVDDEGNVDYASDIVLGGNATSFTSDTDGDDLVALQGETNYYEFTSSDVDGTTFNLGVSDCDLNTLAVYDITDGDNVLKNSKHVRVDSFQEIVLNTNSEDYQPYYVLERNDSGYLQIRYPSSTMMENNSIIAKHGFKAGHRIAVFYRTSNGTDGNIPAAYFKVSISLKMEDGNSVDATIQNIYSGVGGTDAETLTSAKANAPAELKTSDRAVTIEDFDTMLRKHKYVVTSKSYSPDNEPQYFEGYYGRKIYPHEVFSIVTMRKNIGELPASELNYYPWFVANKEHILNEYYNFYNSKKNNLYDFFKKGYGFFLQTGSGQIFAKDTDGNPAAFLNNTQVDDGSYYDDDYFSNGTTRARILKNITAFNTGSVLGSTISSEVADMTSKDDDSFAEIKVHLSSFDGQYVKDITNTLFDEYENQLAILKTNNNIIEEEHPATFTSKSLSNEAIDVSKYAKMDVYIDDVIKFSVDLKSEDDYGKYVAAFEELYQNTDDIESKISEKNEDTSSAYYLLVDNDADFFVKFQKGIEDDDEFVSKTYDDIKTYYESEDAATYRKGILQIFREAYSSILDDDYSVITDDEYSALKELYSEESDILSYTNDEGYTVTYNLLYNLRDYSTDEITTEDTESNYYRKCFYIIKTKNGTIYSKEVSSDEDVSTENQLSLSRVNNTSKYIDVGLQIPYTKKSIYSNIKDASELEDKMFYINYGSNDVDSVEKFYRIKINGNIYKIRIDGYTANLAKNFYEKCRYVVNESGDKEYYDIFKYIGNGNTFNKKLSMNSFSEYQASIETEYYNYKYEQAYESELASLVAEYKSNHWQDLYNQLYASYWNTAVASLKTSYIQTEEGLYDNILGTIDSTNILYDFYVKENIIKTGNVFDDIIASKTSKLMATELANDQNTFWSVYDSEISAETATITAERAKTNAESLAKEEYASKERTYIEENLNSLLEERGKKYAAGYLIGGEAYALACVSGTEANVAKSDNADVPTHVRNQLIEKATNKANSYISTISDFSSADATMYYYNDGVPTEPLKGPSSNYFTTSYSTNEKGETVVTTTGPDLHMIMSSSGSDTEEYSKLYNYYLTKYTQEEASSKSIENSYISSQQYKNAFNEKLSDYETTDTNIATAKSDLSTTFSNGGKTYSDIYDARYKEVYDEMYDDVKEEVKTSWLSKDSWTTYLAGKESDRKDLYKNYAIQAMERIGHLESDAETIVNYGYSTEDGKGYFDTKAATEIVAQEETLKEKAKDAADSSIETAAIAASKEAAEEAAEEEATAYVKEQLETKLETMKSAIMLKEGLYSAEALDTETATFVNSSTETSLNDAVYTDDEDNTYFWLTIDRLALVLNFLLSNYNTYSNTVYIYNNDSWEDITDYSVSPFEGNYRVSCFTRKHYCYNSSSQNFIYDDEDYSTLLDESDDEDMNVTSYYENDECDLRFEKILCDYDEDFSVSSVSENDINDISGSTTDLVQYLTGFRKIYTYEPSETYAAEDLITYETSTKDGANHLAIRSTKNGKTSSIYFFSSSSNSSTFMLNKVFGYNDTIEKTVGDKNYCFSEKAFGIRKLEMLIDVNSDYTIYDDESLGDSSNYLNVGDIIFTDNDLNLFNSPTSIMLSYKLSNLYPNGIPLGRNNNFYYVDSDGNGISAYDFYSQYNSLPSTIQKGGDTDQTVMVSPEGSVVYYDESTSSYKIDKNTSDYCVKLSADTYEDVNSYYTINENTLDTMDTIKCSNVSITSDEINNFGVYDIASDAMAFRFAIDATSTSSSYSDDLRVVNAILTNFTSLNAIKIYNSIMNYLENKKDITENSFDIYKYRKLICRLAKDNSNKLVFSSLNKNGGNITFYYPTDQDIENYNITQSDVDAFYANILGTNITNPDFYDLYPKDIMDENVVNIISSADDENNATGKDEYYYSPKKINDTRYALRFEYRAFETDSTDDERTSRYADYYIDTTGDSFGNYVFNLCKTDTSNFPDFGFYVHLVNDRTYAKKNSTDEDLLQKYMQKHMIAGTDINFIKPCFKTFDITGTIFYNANYSESVVKKNVESALEAKYKFTDIENTLVGNKIYLSDINEILSSIDGVEHVEISYFGFDSSDQTNYPSQTKYLTTGTDDFYTSIVLSDTDTQHGVVFSYESSDD